ncbi:MAG: hypothetical protein WBO73_09990 [Gammaproteobacteria bacterium]
MLQYIGKCSQVPIYCNNLEGLHCGVEFVAVVHRDGVAQLLARPFHQRVGGHIAMDNPLRMMFAHDQYIEQPKRCLNDDTEVTGQYTEALIANKGRPALIATGLSAWSFWHVVAYRMGRYAIF